MTDVLIEDTRRLQKEAIKLINQIRDNTQNLITLGYAKHVNPCGAILISKDREWLKGIDSIGRIYTNNKLIPSDVFLVDKNLFNTTMEEL